MNILTSKVSEITFEEIVEFCKEGKSEGFQIDYKRERPKDGFAKHFCAFSNSQGGLIIVGVEEDRDTGMPKVFDGIPKEGKLLEQVHQDASNIDPLPNYEAVFTNEVDKKCFLLIRIYEGAETPYHVNNDARFWIRTGSIAVPISDANPKQVEQMYGKRIKAEESRKQNVLVANEMFQAQLRKGEVERIKKVSQSNPPDTTSRGLQNPLGTHSTMCEILLQPYNPNGMLAKPLDLFSIARNVIFQQSNEYTFTNPHGIEQFNWNIYDGSISCSFVFSNGLVYLNLDVAIVETGQTIKVVQLSKIVSQLIAILHNANNYYSNFGYQGSIVGSIVLTNVEGSILRPISTDGFGPGSYKIIYPKYHWPLELSTRVLFDSEQKKEWLIRQVQSMYVYFGIEPPSDAALSSHLPS